MNRVVPLAAAMTIGLVACSGCAARQNRFSSRFIKPGQPAASFDDPSTARPPQDLHEYARKLRELQAKATPKTNLVPTIEARDPELSKALLRLAMFETAENHRLVAAAYRNAGITDYAYRHLQRALQLDPCDSLAHEGLARLWRDWGMADLALGDAYRALYCRPGSASAFNTLGTVFEALGQRTNARQAFERAVRIDNQAGFALNNLCYLSLQDGDVTGARRACERALGIEPTMTAARNNLALAYALDGDVKGAEIRLLDSPDRAQGEYNVGILRMSLGKYWEAAAAFDLAAAERPSLWEAARRSVQARTMAQREQ